MSLSDDLSDLAAELEWRIDQDEWWASPAAAKIRIDGIVLVRLVFLGGVVRLVDDVGDWPMAVANYKARSAQ